LKSRIDSIYRGSIASLFGVLLLVAACEAGFIDPQGGEGRAAAVGAVFAFVAGTVRRFYCGNTDCGRRRSLAYALIKWVFVRCKGRPGEAEEFIKEYGEPDGYRNRMCEDCSHLFDCGAETARDCFVQRQRPAQKPIKVPR
jgi:hypothetical protein